MWETNWTVRSWQGTARAESIRGQLKPHCMSPPRITRVVTELQLCFALKVEFLIDREEKRVEKLQYEHFAVETNPEYHVPHTQLMSRQVLSSTLDPKPPKEVEIDVTTTHMSPEPLPADTSVRQGQVGRGLEQPDRVKDVHAHDFENVTTVAIIRESLSTFKVAVEVKNSSFPLGFCVRNSSNPQHQEAVGAGNSPPAADLQALKLNSKFNLEKQMEKILSKEQDGVGSGVDSLTSHSLPISDCFDTNLEKETKMMDHSKQVVTINQQQTLELASAPLRIKWLVQPGRGLIMYLSWSWAVFISRIYLKANQNTFKPSRLVPNLGTIEQRGIC
ncbi:hypothetical protein WISP_118802 [Willisornis vidua]|uniref:Uncharacterized protein n=1 Tax=Willisornis vidua TaxID=1566151 RepID=A0ABQ9CZ48_9PASS|nr:hypothetical protein WISP_118802 [Willisornis vidua]